MRDLKHPLLVSECDRSVLRPHLHRVLRGPGDGPELGGDGTGHLTERDGLSRHLELAGVEPRQVEQLGRELRQPLHLFPHAQEELSSGRLVELLVGEQLEEAAQREERRAQLVGSIGDELSPRAVEPRQPAAHALEGPRQLADLVGSQVDHRLVEPTSRTALRGALELANPHP
jgi:hypothetical protein